jgi:hypothetical protein
MMRRIRGESITEGGSAKRLQSGEEPGELTPGSGDDSSDDLQKDDLKEEDGD